MKEIEDLYKNIRKEWFPMETAPKDGTIIWVVYNKPISDGYHNLKPWRLMKLFMYSTWDKCWRVAEKDGDFIYNVEQLECWHPYYVPEMPPPKESK